MREIRKKLVILRNRAPFSQEVKVILEEKEYREWIYMNLGISGSSLKIEEIDALMQGEMAAQATIEDCLLIDRLKELRKFIYRLTDMKIELSEQIFRDMHAIVTGRETRAQYRRGNPFLDKYGCVARPADQIAGSMAELLKVTRVASLDGAAMLGREILRVYPFNDGNELLAWAAMYYKVAEMGLPLAAIPAGGFQQNTYSPEFMRQFNLLDKVSAAQISKLLRDGIYERLEEMCMLTSHEI